MEHRLLDYPAAAKMLDDDALEQLGCDSGVPDALRIDHDDGAASADAQTRCLTAFHAVGAEQQVFSLEERRQQAIQLTPAPIRRAETARAHEHMAAVRIHLRSADGVGGRHDG